MRVLNIGSMNLDNVYRVDHIVAPGETEATGGVEVFLGGKGLNQSVALARAGVEVYQGGMIGEDGQPFLDACAEYGVHSAFIRRVDGRSGHTVIQLDKNAQNSILLFGGANQRLTAEYVDGVLAQFGADDLLLLQNEVNLLPYIVDRAHEKGLRIALNPSPFNEKLDAVDLNKIGLFLLNEVEGFQLTGEREPGAILDAMRTRYPRAAVVLTLGAEGAYYDGDGERVFQPAFPVEAVDTTAAGDTFTGYFIAGLAEGLPVAETMRRSARAAAIAVTRPGAAPSIPSRAEVER
ncbi:MAG: ribokinase, partial [Butyricicoccus sp.]